MQTPVSGAAARPMDLRVRRGRCRPQSASMRQSRKRLLRLGLALGGLALVAAAPDPLLGVSAQDGVGDSHRAAVARWAEWLGRPLADIGHIQDNIFAGDWAELESGAAAYFQREENWRGFDEAFKARFELNLPMFPGAAEYGLANEAKWADGAAGEFDAHFTRLAENLVAAGFGRAALRLAWEFNGSGGQFPWHVAHGDAAAQARRTGRFKAYWRRIHAAMSRAGGARFRWVWCPMVSENHAFDPTAAWPGDAFVDVVSVDFYDTQGEYYWADPAELAAGRDAFLELSDDRRALRRQFMWDKWVRGRDYDIGAAAFRAEPPSYRGLEWLYDFARRRGKPFALSEWGIWPRYVRLDDGSGPYFSTAPPGRGPAVFGYADSRTQTDNPDFIARVHAWLKTHPVAWACYFDVRLASDLQSPFIDHSLSPRPVGGVTASQHPRAAAAYRKLFGR